MARTLGENLKHLLSRVKSGGCQALPVKRAYASKGKEEQRLIGLPTIENKVLERAVSMVFEPIHEEEFYDFSYGFRPGRNAQQALSHLRAMSGAESAMDPGGGPSERRTGCVDCAALGLRGSSSGSSSGRAYLRRQVHTDVRQCLTIRRRLYSLG